IGSTARPLGARFLRRPVEDRIAHRLWQLAPRRVEIELDVTRERREHDLPQISARLSPGENHTLENRDARIAEDELFAHLPPRAESTAFRTGAERRVEREMSRLELGKRDSARRTAVPLGEHLLGAGLRVHDLDDAVRQLECGLDRIGTAAAGLRANQQAT